MKNKKAFTVVELVIVIAIIAILAAVLIPTFASLIKKANVSKDMQLIRNLNTALATDRASKNNEKHPTMTDALAAAEAFGYDVGKINVSATDNMILWDQKNDVFCYLDGDQIKYIPESTSEPITDKDDYRLWEIYTGNNKTVPAKANQKHSIYLGQDAIKPDDDTYCVGVDVGKRTDIETIIYNNSEEKSDVVIRTNGGTLTVNGTNDTVLHYGFATVVNVQDVKAGTYKEFGIVGRLIYTDNNGKILFGSTAVVYCYMNASTDAGQDLSDANKMPGAIVYTNVSSAAVATVFEGKTVTLVDGNLVDVATCHNHNEDYDVIVIGGYKYVICKCCGAFSKYTEENAAPVASSEGISTGNSNTFDYSPLPLMTLPEVCALLVAADEGDIVEANFAETAEQLAVFIDTNRAQYSSLYSKGGDVAVSFKSVSVHNAYYDWYAALGKDAYKATIDDGHPNCYLIYEYTITHELSVGNCYAEFEFGYNANELTDLTLDYSLQVAPGFTPPYASVKTIISVDNVTEGNEFIYIKAASPVAEITSCAATDTNDSSVTVETVSPGLFKVSISDLYTGTYNPDEFPVPGISIVVSSPNRLCTYYFIPEFVSPYVANTDWAAFFLGDWSFEYDYTYPSSSWYGENAGKHIHGTDGVIRFTNLINNYDTEQKSWGIDVKTDGQGNPIILSTSATTDGTIFWWDTVTKNNGDEPYGQYYYVQMTESDFKEMFTYDSVEQTLTVKEGKYLSPSCTTPETGVSVSVTSGMVLRKIVN